MGDQHICIGCGFAIDQMYWVNNPPDLCTRCYETLLKLSRCWRSAVKEQRTATHIAFATNYATAYAHGAPGHIDLMTIALLARVLDDPIEALR